METYVYLLVHAEKPKFKIGIGVAPYLRSKSLPQEFNFVASIAYVFPDQQSARFVEKMLHYLFSEAYSPEAGGRGYTEWFNFEVFQEVKGFLVENQKRMKYLREEEIVPITIEEARERQRKEFEVYLANREQRESLALLKYLEKCIEMKSGAIDSGDRVSVVRRLIQKRDWEDKLLHWHEYRNLIIRLKNGSIPFGSNEEGESISVQMTGSGRRLHASVSRDNYAYIPSEGVVIWNFEFDYHDIPLLKDYSGPTPHIQEICRIMMEIVGKPSDDIPTTVYDISGNKILFNDSVLTATR